MTKQQRYTSEFRAEAIKLVSELGLSQETATKRLSIPKGILENWMTAAKASKRLIEMVGGFNFVIIQYLVVFVYRQCRFFCNSARCQQIL